MLIVHIAIIDVCDYTEAVAVHEVDEIDLDAVLQLLSDANPVFQRCKSNAEVAALAQRANRLEELMGKLTKHTATFDAGRLKQYMTTWHREVDTNTLCSTCITLCVQH